jgi:hypothetical protein
MLASRERENNRGGLAVAAAVGLSVIALAAPPASADFPYLPRSGGDPHNPATWRLAPGEAPGNFRGDWKLAATPDTPPAIDPASPTSITQHVLVLEDNGKRDELCGVRGASVVDDRATVPPATGSCLSAGSPVKTAFEVTTGRPDVVIAVLDSGIKWSS